MKKHFYLLLFTILAFSCNKKDDPSPIKKDGQITVFTNPDDSSIKDENWEGWVVIQSLDGSFLEMKELVKGGNVKFESLEDESYHLTFFDKNLSVFGENKFTTLYSYAYLNVPIGSVYTHGLGKSIFENQEFEGDFKISVVAESYGVISGGFSSAPDNNVAFTSSNNTKQIDITQNFRKESAEYLAVVYGFDGIHRYKLLSDVQVGGLYSFNFKDLNYFDQSLIIPQNYLTGLSIRVNSLYEDGNQYKPGFVVNNLSVLRSPEMKNFLLNFLDGIEKYDVSLNFNLDGMGMAYKKIGVPPTKIEFPSNSDFSPQNLSISNFQFQLPTWATSYQARLNKQYVGQDDDIFFSLILEGDLDNFTLLIPNELKEKFSILQDSENFEFSSVTAIKSSYDYQEMIENVLVEEPVLFDFETYSVRKTFE